MTPCFIPARLRVGEQVHEVNLTRIGGDEAQLSTGTEMTPGQHADLELNRPTDGMRVRIGVVVTATREGGIERGWTPAVQVRFDRSLMDADVLRPAPPAATDAPSEESSLGLSQDSFTIEELLPPDPISLQEPTDEELPMLDAAAWEALSEDSVMPWGEFSEDTYLEREEVSEGSEGSEASGGLLSSDGAELPDDATLPPDGSLSQDGKLPDPDRLSEDPEIEWRPDQGTPRRDSAHIPWLDTPAIEELTVEREPRVFSEVAVNYMAAGARHSATVQDFGFEGLYLAVAPMAPVPSRGDMLRIEFPVVTPTEVLKVRLFAEVRWTHGESDPGTDGRGVGLHIVDFESPMERRLYEDYVTALLEDEIPPRQ